MLRDGALHLAGKQREHTRTRKGRPFSSSVCLAPIVRAHVVSAARRSVSQAGHRSVGLKLTWGLYVIGKVIPMGSTYIRLINLFSWTSLLHPPTLLISSLPNNLIKFPWNLAIIKKYISLVWSVWRLHYSFILIVVFLLSFMSLANESWPQEVNLFIVWW